MKFHFIFGAKEGKPLTLFGEWEELFSKNNSFFPPLLGWLATTPSSPYNLKIDPWEIVFFFLNHSNIIRTYYFNAYSVVQCVCTSDLTSKI